MRGENDVLFTWSDQARADFHMSIEGRGGSDFRWAFARAIGTGWDGNRDKPLWALAVLIRELGLAPIELSTAYDILHLKAHELHNALRLSSGPSVKENDDGSLFIEDDAGRFRISPTRIRILQAYLDFIVTCENCEHGETVLSEFIDPLLLGETQNAGPCARNLAKLMYGYRQRHFDDSHATSAYSIVRSLVKSNGDKISDETPLEMWKDATTRPYTTYEKCFYALRDYLQVLAQAVARAEMSRGIEWSEFAQKDDTATTGEASLLAEDTVEELGETCPGMDGPAAIKALETVSVKLFTEKERKFLKPVQEAGAFGKRLPLATLRLMSFGKIQSAISTGLQTKKSKVPLADQVKCQDAVSYEAILTELDRMEQKLKDWMKVALATRPGPSDDGPLDDFRAQGQRILAAQRSKTFDQDAKALARIFADVTPALINASTSVRDLQAAASRRCGAKTETLFELDRENFAAILADIYLNDAYREGVGP